jgi:nucleoside-diphosphate-sugar epimerase
VPNQLSGNLKILVTGGCGKIGSYFVRFADDRYQIRVVDREQWDTEQLGAFRGESLVFDLQNPEGCRKACQGMDVVVHLAADPDPEADFLSSLLPNNILSTYYMFQAAKDAGCKRFIFASSVHAVAAYPRDVQIKADMAVRPTGMYGISKCFGEALAAHYATNEGLPSIAIRIGGYLFPEEIGPEERDYLDGYLHPDDFNQLLAQCIETPGLTFAIVHAISNNRYKRLDLTETKQILGYAPTVDGFEITGLLPAASQGEDK